MPAIKPIPNNNVRSRGKIEQHEHCDIADAKRVKIVDEFGQEINSSNPLAVDASVSEGAPSEIDLSIQNIPLALAADIAQINLPEKTVRVILKLQEDDADYRYAFSIAELSTNFIKVPAGNSVTLDDIFSSNTRLLFVQVEKDNSVVQLQVQSQQT